MVSAKPSLVRSTLVNPSAARYVVALKCARRIFD
jgi:hypothetical protein